MIQNHNSNQNPVFLNNLKKKAEKNEFIKEFVPLFMPYIGDNYRKKKILVVAGRPEHYSALKKYKKDSINDNYCDYLMKNDDKGCKRLQKDILDQMKSAGMTKVKINDISFYNFQFKPNDMNTAQWFKGKNLEELYNIFTNDVLGILKPKKIFFYGDAYDGINTRLKKPKVFENKNLDEFLKSKQIRIYRVSKCNYDNIAALLNAYWFIREAADFMQNHLRQNNNQFGSCIKQMQKYLRVFEKGIDSIVKNLPRTEREKINLPHDVNKLRIMLTYLYVKDLYIHYALVPQFMEFAYDLYEKDKLYRKNNIIAAFAKKTKKNISLDEAEKYLISLIGELNPNTDKESLKRCERIFKSTLKNKESLKICSPSDYEQICGRKPFFKKKKQSNFLYNV